jgi:hypothetical protein
MAQFYMTIRGSGADATKTGTKGSGGHAMVHGWDCGIIVDANHHSDGFDLFRIYATGGSNDPRTKKLVATVYRMGDEIVVDAGQYSDEERIKMAQLAMREAYLEKLAENLKQYAAMDEMFKELGMEL